MLKSKVVIRDLDTLSSENFLDQLTNREQERIVGGGSIGLIVATANNNFTGGGSVVSSGPNQTSGPFGIKRISLFVDASGTLPFWPS